MTITANTNKQIKEINENAHTKIMRDMSSFLDECKNKKENCQCSGVLEFDPNESNELKKWKFIYQCDSNKDKNIAMKNITIDFLQNIKDFKEEIYNVRK
jgi:hypothetical protein